MSVRRVTAAPRGQTTARLLSRRRPAQVFSVSSDQGGEPKPLVAIDRNADEWSHRWPHFLPGGRAILFTVKSTNLQSFDDAQIVVRSLDTGEQHPVAQGNSAQYVPTGHVVYARAGALYAVRFDAARLAVTGAPVKVADGIITHPDTGGAQVAISQTGTLVYAAGDVQDRRASAVVGRSQRTARPVSDRQAPFWWPRISPDGRRIAVTIDGAFSKLWVFDVERGTFTRASQLAGDQDRSRGRPMAVTSHWVQTRPALARFAFSPTASMAPATPPSSSTAPESMRSDWSPDGRRLLYGQTGATTGRDVSIYSSDDRTSKPFLRASAERVFGLLLAGWPLGRVRVRRIRPGRGLRAAIPGPGQPDTDFRSTAARLRCGRETAASSFSRRATRFSRRQSASAEHLGAAPSGVCFQDRTASRKPSSITTWRPMVSVFWCRAAASIGSPSAGARAQLVRGVGAARPEVSRRNSSESPDEPSLTSAAA